MICLEIGMILYNLYRDTTHWPNKELIRAILKLGHKVKLIDISKLVGVLGSPSKGVWYEDTNLTERLSAALLRNLGSASCDQFTFRLSILEHLELSGVPLINSTYPTRRAKEKYISLVYLERHGIKIPHTIVSEDLRLALQNYPSLNDIVVKPLVGARGLGSIRISDFDIAYRTYKTLSRLGQVIYSQKYIEKLNRDIRIFVIGDEIVGSIYRKAPPGMWKTNVAQGATVEAFNPNEELRELALKSVEILELEYAGVDVVEGSDGYYILEVNPIPSWEGLQTTISFNIAEKIISHVVQIVKK